MGDDRRRIRKDEYDLWLQEVAVEIANAGSDWVRILLAFAPHADESQLRAILLALSRISENLSEDQRHSLCGLARGLLADRRPMVVAEAVDTLTSLGCPRVKESIAALRRHSSPYVRGSVLRHFARRHPRQAVPLLEKALDSKQPIVRQNAVDELDEMNYTPALAKIKRLLADPDEDVRRAARTAVEHLENGGH
jgi:HEAT repeat protein